LKREQYNLGRVWKRSSKVQGSKVQKVGSVGKVQKVQEVQNVQKVGFGRSFLFPGGSPARDPPMVEGEQAFEI